MSTDMLFADDVIRESNPFPTQAQKVCGTQVLNLSVEEGLGVCAANPTFQIEIIWAGMGILLRFSIADPP